MSGTKSEEKMMEPITMVALILGTRMLVRWLESGDGKKAMETVGQIALLAWQTISDWLAKSKVEAGDSGVLIRENLANGNYRIVCGVFSKNGEQRQQTVWECSSLDSELKRKLSGKDHVTIKL
jgi:hypothetical protein